ncbi:ribonuclease H-like domain-containing protein [Candidatus Methanomassiliicoccus intestinalis]|uniref:YprB ribonuclease H-like domain-containing protein n=1 Tax=Candidatus Methanomassiliicoccus intestinalis TaxID=1406512 RepID=A0A8J8PH71_9ARCH|nr:MAG: hypothetical protein A3207_03420 [Candidatus Methanomassiliicoccus intestinalis]
MIRRTFLILPSLGKKKEVNLWKEGILDWNDFVSTSKIKGISAERKENMDALLLRADQSLENRQSEYFSKILPSVEHWRMLDNFWDDAAYLDIETSGRSRYASVTVVGIYYKGKMTSLVKGEDLTFQNLSDSLKDAKMLVTFNGSSFDLPILEYHFPFAVPKVPHCDLRHACRRAGYCGGLKSIEKQMGMFREKEVEYMTGEEAVYLWRAWERSKSKNALKLLVKYNEEDVLNLEPIAKTTYSILKQKLIEEADI